MNQSRDNRAYGKETKLLLSLRVIVFTALFGGTQLLMPTNWVLQTLMVVYGILAIIYLSVTAIYRRPQPEWLVKISLSLQVVLELLIEGFLVRTTGGTESPFSMLFLLSIASASLVFHLRGSLVASCLAAIFYFAGIFAVHARSDFFLPTLGDVQRFYTDTPHGFIGVLLNICLFFIIALITGHLGRQIAQKSTELQRMKIETGEILQQMRSGLVGIDAAGNIVYFNRSAARLFGKNIQEARGRHFADVLDGCLTPVANILSSTLAEARSISRLELKLVLPEGRELPLGISTSAIADQQGHPRGVVAVFQDLTAAKKMEEKMRLADRIAATGQLAAGIAHEIRNPLAAISGSAQILQSELNLSGQNAELMELVIKESARLNQIVSDFLEFSRIRARPPKETNLSDVVSDVVAMAVKHPSFRPGITIVNGFEQSPAVLALGDFDQAKQMLLNLLLNAIESIGGSRGMIRILPQAVAASPMYAPSVDFTPSPRMLPRHEKDKLLHDPELVAVSIIDDGCGMTPEVIRKLFQPFHTTKPQGTGLGLAVVARLAQGMGCRLTFSSRPGSGSVFSLYLQAVPAGKKPDPARQTSMGPAPATAS